MSFSTDIKNIRLQMFLTQQEFARELGVSFATVNRWEKGKAKPTIKTMRQINSFCQKNNLVFNINHAINSDLGGNDDAK